MPLPDDAAETAAESVRRLFLTRSLGVPGTRIGAVEYPSTAGRSGHWHYWWQAHLLDCLIDAGLRDPSGSALAEARKVARGVWLRNGGRWRNSYYDDMAWLALALQRLGALRGDVDGRRRPRRRVRVLGAALASAHTADLGGGVYWNTTRDYKNTPSTAPAALFFARAGRTDRAADLLDWLRERLYDDATGLYLDGVRADGTVERTIHTYNQGTVLGALVTVGGPENLARAAALIRSVERHIADERGVLPLAAGGDAGLFTGILARYLAVAARTPTLDPDAADVARRLVVNTSEHLWAGRSASADGPGSTPSSAPVFPPLGDGPVSLSSQLQAWTVLEAESACRRP
jgi:predicted alpha-1,6-mannanase (GH76 family)